ncbi:response regulator transcription factor [Streptomyces sp. NBC_00322]|uniref:response regulator transcription factor n=1 Tax=Streptomyces sp. NBC_00322 TaxID=2975712 RepID=UPI002E2DA8CC|nr:response regulator transcription factor [Streptomyces sp. NBC_00322]
MLVARHQLERAQIRTTLEADHRYRVVAEGVPGQECDLVCRTRPDVVIVSQPEEGAALGALKRITETPMPPAALLLADRLTGDGVRRLLRLRAAGILHRATAGRHLQWAVHAAAHGGLALEPGLARDLADTPTEPAGAGAGTEQARAQALLGALSPREREVIALAGDGMSNPEIAAILTISADTAKDHLHHIYAKLGIRSRLQAARIVWQAGLGDSTRGSDRPAGSPGGHCPPVICSGRSGGGR